MPKHVFLGILLTLPLVALAGDEERVRAPSEEAAFAATRAFVHLVQVMEPEHEPDVIARYVDPDGLGRRIFGGAWDSGDEAQREAARRSLLGSVLPTFLRALGRGGYRVPDDLRSSLQEGGVRRVDFRLGRRSFLLVWARRGPVPVLVDVGSDGDGAAARLASLWKSAARTTTLGRFLETLVRRGSDRSRKVESKDNIRTLIQMMLLRVTQKGVRGWPRHSGKNFILYLAATGMVDVRNPANLEVFYSPGRGERRRPAPEAYREVTMEALNAGRDFSHLTDYAGRRNGERAFRVTADQMKLGTPLIADLSFPDVAIIGFSNGAVREVTREELGLGPDDPMVAGDESNSPILRKLSSR